MSDGSTEGREDRAGQSQDHRPSLSPGTLGLLVVAVLLARVLVWMQSDLWYDEVVTLVEFAIGGEGSGISRVFRHYPIANNHMVFSAIAWVWVRLVGFTLVEPVLRAPSLICAVLAVVCVWRFWGKSLGKRVAVFAALALAASPVLSPLFYQFRGYSLSILLAVLATAGAHELSQGELRRGAWLSILPCLLLPLVIPSNVLLVAALALYVLLARGGSAGTRLKAGVICGVPGLLGASYYLTIWPQFLKVMKQTAGWSSGWLVAGHLLLALVAHLGPVCIVLAASLFGRSQLVGQARRERRDAAAMVAACALGVMLGILSSQSAPFPRVFAVFFVPLGWAAFRLCRQASFWQSRSPLLAGGAIVISAFAWERGADLLTLRQVAAGKHPQNLLQQYYRGDSELGGLVGELRQRKLADSVLVLTNAHDFRTLDFYWRSRDLPTEASGSERGPGLRRVVAVNDNNRVALCREATQCNLRLLVLAHSEEGAARIFGECEQIGQIEKVLVLGSRALYALVPSGSNVGGPVQPPGNSALQL